MNARIGRLVLALSCVLLIGCWPMGDLRDMFATTTTRTVNALNDAIAALETQSADWQKVLQDMQARLTRDAQSTLRNEIANLAARSVAQAGVEFRCNADFVGGRARQFLIRKKAEWLKQPVPPVEPSICQVVPLAVDRELVPARLKQVEFYGYDFNEAKNLGVFLERSSGGRVSVTRTLDRPTHYAMTLKFGPTGVQLDAQSQRLVLEWGGERISTIAIIQPATPVCQSKTVTVRPGTVTWRPPKVRGDGDFDGNGPKVSASVTLFHLPTSLKAIVEMRAKESESDWTEASGSKIINIFTPDSGWYVERVAGDRSSSQKYTDSNYSVDSFDMGSGGPVRRFGVRGGHEGCGSRDAHTSGRDL